MNKIIDVGFNSTEKILHVADIHIRNYKRHKEYKQVFRKLYKEARKTPKETVIYVGGDIVHTKTDISPELIQMVSDFFNTLAKIRPTIVITGNHDANLNNPSRLDSLSPIVDNLNNPNLHYLKDSGIYTIAGINYIVMSVFDDPKNYLTKKDLPKGYNIALYHGPVNKSQTDIGYVVDNPHMTTKMFDGYDLVLLGDIHKKQFLNDEKTICYVGSLIQQNFGETFENHGYMLWDVKTKKSEFFEIENDFGYYTIDVKDGKPLNLNRIPKKPRLRLRTENTTAADIKNIIVDIKKKYKIQDVTIIRQDNILSQKGDEITGIEITRDVRSAEYQNQLLEDYLVRRFTLDEDMISRIKVINSELNKILNDIDIGRHIHWKPKKFEFSNMFSYGEGNTMDFENLSGSIGLFAPNHSGKSALFDALSFCVFDRCSRSRHGMDVMNNKKKTFHCKLNFEIDGIDYFIERHGKRFKSGGVRVDTDFWMIDESGEKVSLNGEQRKDTNKNIQGYLGAYEDFTLTALSVQNNNTGFIDKTQSEKKDLLAQFLDITVFEELYQLATDEISDVAAVLKQFRDTDFESQLIEYENSLKSFKEKYSEVESKNNKIKTTLKKLNDKQLEHSSKLITTFNLKYSISELISKRKNIKDTIEFLQSKLNKYEKYTVENKVKLQDINKKLAHLDENEVTSNKMLYDSTMVEKTKITNELDKLKIIVKNKLEKLSAIGQFDPNCDFCKNTPFVQSSTKIENSLNGDKVLAKKNIEKINQLDSTLEKLKPSLIDYDNLTSYKSELQTIKQYESEIRIKTSKNETLIANNKHDLTKVNDLIDKYYNNESAIKSNQRVQKKIDDIKESINELNLELRKSTVNSQDMYSDIKVYENKILTIKTSIKEAEELEKRYKAYEYYLNAIERDGIPYELISAVLPYIEDEVNNILSQIVDFKILFNVDGKKINTYISYTNDDFWSLELTSGMEKFISSLAIRVALVNISNLPRPNFLAIDEGFGNLDSQNINSMSNLFDYLKTQFDFMMVISHIDVMKDIMDDSIEIDTSNEFSRICY